MNLKTVVATSITGLVVVAVVGWTTFVRRESVAEQGGADQGSNSSHPSVAISHESLAFKLLPVALDAGFKAGAIPVVRNTHSDDNDYISHVHPTDHDEPHEHIYRARAEPDGSLSLNVFLGDGNSNLSFLAVMSQSSEGEITARVSGRSFLHLSPVVTEGALPSEPPAGFPDFDPSLRIVSGRFTINSLDWTVGQSIAVRMQLEFVDGDEHANVTLESSAQIEEPRNAEARQPPK